MSFEIGDIVKNMESHFNVRAIPLFGRIIAMHEDPTTLNTEYQVGWENGTFTYCYDHELAPVSVQEYNTAKKQEEAFIKSLKESKNIAVTEPVVELVKLKKIMVEEALETLKDYYREKIQQIEQMQKDIMGGKE